MENNILERILAEQEAPCHLPFELLQSITQNFSQARKIGDGGFGEVYMGILRNGCIVAVKMIHVTIHTVDDKLFNRQLRRMLKIPIEHQNVVRFLGFCSDTRVEVIRNLEENLLVKKKEMLLCFEYISNGSLDKHITDELRGLEWNARYEIIMGICKGLQYLHEELHIIHMDLKPSNIMLDIDMVPKITDFDLSRPDGNTHTTGVVFLSRDYAAPEYRNDSKISKQCDMFSLGVLIKELITGSRRIPHKNYPIRRWRHRWTKSASHMPLKEEQVTKCIEIAERCSENDPNKRPTISHMIHLLEEIGSKNGQTFGQIIPYSGDDMLGIEPLELNFSFQINKQVSCSLEIINATGDYFAFHIESPSLEYCTEPNKGIVPPYSSRSVTITLQAQETAPQAQSNEFTVRSAKFSESLTDDNITEGMFSEDAGRMVDEVNLTVVYEIGQPKENRPVFGTGDLNCSPEESNVPTEAVSTDNIASSSSIYGDTRVNTTFPFPLPRSQHIEKPSNIGYMKRISDQSIDLVTGAMASLPSKLNELLKEEYNLQTSLKNDIKSLSLDLIEMHEALRKVSQVPWDNLNELVKLWASEVRELSFDIEDVIDDFLISVKGFEPAVSPNDFRGLIKKMINMFKWGMIPPQIRDVIQQIKSQIQVVASRGKTYNVDGVAANLATTTTIDLRLLALYKNQNEIIGIEGARDDILSMLNHQEDIYKKQLKIISIFGIGGLGKTTLAKAVYDGLRKGFPYMAFVPVGRNPDVKKVFKDIILEIVNNEYTRVNLSMLDEKQLIDELRRVLKNKRYFIIIDDIWASEAWKIIKCSLVDCNCGSKIIITTRSYEVAAEAGDVYKLKSLSGHDSEKLLRTRLSGHKSSYDELNKLSGRILQKCGGVPLAIITIASLLASKPWQDWSKVCNSIGFGSGENEEVKNTRKILLFSYYDLPCYLRTCLVHLSIYPEDYIIKKKTLIWKWIGEGFIHEEEQGVRLFDIGERYFNELINRSMIQPVESNIGITYACRVHDMVLDIICSLSEKQNFVTILDNNENPTSSHSNNARRLAVQRRVIEQQDPLSQRLEMEAELNGLKPHMAQVRSFNATMCHFNIMPSVLGFKVLRVLAIEKCTFMEGRPCQLVHLGKLAQLRYLGLRSTVIEDLPEEIGDLVFLQILDLRYTDGFKILPKTLALLKGLRCLRALGGSIRGTDWTGSLTSLEELSFNRVEDCSNFLKGLTNLRVLKMLINMSEENWNKDLVESLCNMQKIQVLELRCGSEEEEINWEGYVPPRQLRELNLDTGFSKRLPWWINSALVPCLTQLEVRVNIMEARDLEILGMLPELYSLLLIMPDNSLFPELVGSSGALFPELRYCLTSAPLRFPEGAMRRLQSVKFYLHLKALKHANIGYELDSLSNVPCLQDLSVIIDSSGVNDQRVIKEAEDAARHAAKHHPNGPVVHLSQISSMCYDEAIETSVALSSTLVAGGGRRRRRRRPSICCWWPPAPGAP